MTIKSEIYRGKIYSGATQLSNTITITQTGLMQLTVKAGTFINTKANAWILVNNQVFDLASDEDYPTSVILQIGDINGIVDVWCGTKIMDGIEEFDEPEGWNKGHNLTYNFEIPAGCTDLTPIDIYVLEVLPGFPDGTTEDDWKMQIGGA